MYINKSSSTPASLQAIEQIRKQINEDLNQTEAEIKKLLESTLGGVSKRMEVKPCNMISAKWQGINNSLIVADTGLIKIDVGASTTKMLQLLDSLKDESEKIHESNLPAIKNNEGIIANVVKFMDAIGFDRSYSTYEYPSPRHKTKQHKTHKAGWVQDCERLLKVNDDYSIMLNEYERIKKQINEWNDAKYRELKAAEIAEKKRLEEIEKTQMLGILVIKYQLPYTSSYNDVLDHLLNMSKYLKLCHGMYTDSSNFENHLAWFKTTISGEKDQSLYNQLFLIKSNYNKSTLALTIIRPLISDNIYNDYILVLKNI